MKTTEKNLGKMIKRTSYLGIGLCAVACTLPVIGTIAGFGILSSLAYYFEKAGILVLILSAGLFTFWYYKKKIIRTSCVTSCDTSSGGTCSCKNEEKAKII